MKDQLLLLVTGIVCAGLAALFFKYTGGWGLFGLFVITSTASFFENRKMRRELKALKELHGSPDK